VTEIVPRPTAASSRPHRSFDEVLRSIADVEGWLTREQAGRLWDRASELRPGARIVEIGSFRGRSAIVLASSAPDGVEIITIDPHGGNDRGPQEIEGFEAQAQEDHEVFLANLERAGVRQRITHLRRYSTDALDLVAGEVDLLYIDGAHRFSPALSDIRRWGGRVTPGGTLLIHDAFSSIGVTGALAVSLFWDRGFRYVGRSGSLAEYRKQPVRGLARLTNAARQVAQLPWFTRNVLLKLLITLRLRPVYRLLGSDGTWPY
jgi:predicted O-methyltransferase YrrM